MARIFNNNFLNCEEHYADCLYSSWENHIYIYIYIYIYAIIIYIYIYAIIILKYRLNHLT